MLNLRESRPRVGSAWTDDGKPHDKRGLKGRAKRVTRPVPISPLEENGWQPWRHVDLRSVADREWRTCATCQSPIRSYLARLYPVDSRWFERCLSLAWCSGCRVYTSATVHVARERVLVDSLAAFPEEERERLGRSTYKLLDHLDRQERRAAKQGQRPAEPG